MAKGFLMFLYFSAWNPERDLQSYIWTTYGVSPEYPKWDQNWKFIPLSDMISIPSTFMSSPSPPPPPPRFMNTVLSFNLSYLPLITFHEHLLGTPDTNLKGLRTLNALKAFTSKLPELKNAFTKIVAILKRKIYRKMFCDIIKHLTNSSILN